MDNEDFEQLKNVLSEKSKRTQVNAFLPEKRINKVSSSGSAGIGCLIAIGIIMIDVILLLGFAGYFQGGNLDKLFPSSYVRPDIVTLEKFQGIQIGMTYKQVVNIIGTTGEELSRGGTGEDLTIMYAWANTSGGNMTAMFQSGRLYIKAQCGLR